jgi:hypothetical protein
MRRLLTLALSLLLTAAPAGATILTFEGLELENEAPIPAAYGDHVNPTCIETEAAAAAVTGTDDDSSDEESDDVGSADPSGPEDPRILCCDGTGCYGEGNGFTPNVTVAYRTTRLADGSVPFQQLAYWQRDYGDLEDVAYAPEDGMLAEVALVPDEGFQVILNGFDLAGWPREDIKDQIVRIVDGGGAVILDLSPVDVDGAPEYRNRRRGRHAAEEEASHTSVRLPRPIVSTTSIKIQFGPDWRAGIDNIDFEQAVVASPGSGEGGACTMDAESHAQLNATASELLDCRGDLADVTREVRDDDDDGQPDILDACPGTAAGAAIDAAGCSVEQFCGQADATTPTGRRLCKRLDWDNDEPRMKPGARDCTLDRPRRGPQEARCIPTLTEP